MQGNKCKAYYLSTGTRATWGTQDETSGRNQGVAPVGLALIESVKDVTLPGERKTGTSSDRGTTFETGDTGAQTGNVTLNLNHRKTDAARAAIEAAFILNEPISMAFLDAASDVVGAKGLWAEFKVAKCQRSEPEEGAVTYAVELIPYDQATVNPEWVEVISGV